MLKSGRKKKSFRTLKKRPHADTKNNNKGERGKGRPAGRAGELGKQKREEGVERRIKVG